ncbi:MAG: hypothetical protein ACM3PZ_00080 [Bacillota bacterium]
MPLTPSIGLSVLVHLIVLLVYGIRRVFGSAKRNSLKSIRIHHAVINNRFLGIIIPITISVVIFSGAFKLVELSVQNRYSSIHLVRQYLDNLPQGPQAISSQIALQSRLDEQSVPPVAEAGKVEAAFDCTPLFNNFASEYGWSLVNYLTAKGLPQDLPFRKNLAAEVGIQGYDGSSAKNIELLQTLFIRNSEGGLPKNAICRL